MEKTGTGCLDLDEIMPKADGQCTEGRKQPAESPSWEDGICAEEREEKHRREKKSTTVALGRKMIFPFCKTFQAVKRARCRLFQPFNMNVSGFILHFKCFYFI